MEGASLEAYINPLLEEQAWKFNKWRTDHAATADVVLGSALLPRDLSAPWQPYRVHPYV